ncbi:3,4-dihydroxy-2-butanone-4-phosphate synthase [Auritidibacter ignavus]|uniref:3,4-dihydroxy-2-butanone-4-phosphate synthase n=1 Tax=Auritidibacter ignavus TaxID=678932 RepID=UPI00244CA01D|nr:3,4-dihydroxy-2-butanone-4-phosphate synthase [Auritidibacter ignavus]WGH89896.1 3,4-dihydroxy-2-butanone-4-phosphate synthase [Auritidibacter ignavus]
MSLASIDEAVTALKAGRPVIVADDQDRENEGDVIISAQLVTQESIAWAVKHSSGLLCAPMTREIADRLDLPMMVEHSQDPQATAYTVTVDATEGITTGISAHDRMTTFHRLADPCGVPADLTRPGHVLPLRAVDGGVRVRPGHTEASVELMKLAGLAPVAVIAEIVADDGEMMRLPQLQELGAAEQVPVTTIEKLIDYLNERDPRHATDASQHLQSGTSPVQHRTHRRVSLLADTLVPTIHGDVRIKAYRDRQQGIDHLAVTAPGSANAEDRRDVPLVRVHSECITGEVFGSLKCECGPQLDASLAQIHAEGGAVIYLRDHEGRGIGLANKLRAYALQEQGLDTVEANLQLGLPADARNYEVAAEILAELGMTRVRLLTNNPEKVAQLTSEGITVVDTVPLVVNIHDTNVQYMRDKRDKMGHTLPQTLTITTNTQSVTTAGVSSAQSVGPATDQSTERNLSA